MYQDYYGLRELPFELTPNPKYLFLTKQHREALSTLIYGLLSAKGVTALIGEAGIGKTTLLQAALQSEQCRNVKCVCLVNPTLTRNEFVETLSVRFGLSTYAAQSKAALLRELEHVIRERRARGIITALLIDEAQSLSTELLEEIRLLANHETPTEKLLPLVLAGQPELRDRLNESKLRQLKQRVSLRCEMTPFSQQETAAYLAWRIRTAGGDAARLFTREAVMLIHERSGGIPRTINVMADNALLTGFGLGRQPVNFETVLEVARDFDLQDTRARDLPTLVDQLQQETWLVPQPTYGVAADGPVGNQREDADDAIVASAAGHAPAAEAVAVSDGVPAMTATGEDEEEVAPPEDPRPIFGSVKPRARFSFFSR